MATDITTKTERVLDIEGITVVEETKTTYGASLDLDSAEEIVVPALGKHSVFIESWENVPEQWIEPNDGKTHSADQIRHIDPHLDLRLRDADSGLLYQKNVYGASLPGMLKSMNRQTFGALGGKKTTAVLDYFRNVHLDVWAVWNKEEERTEVFFFDIEAFRARQDAQKTTDPDKVKGKSTKRPTERKATK